MIAVGLMSGTSLDGIDAALVRLRPCGARYKVDLLNFSTTPFEPSLREMLAQALPPNVPSPAQQLDLHRKLGEAFGRSVLEVCGNMPLDYVASHGLTLYHDGDRHLTLQIGDPYVIRSQAECTVCFDFRSADCAAGGHGAPLVPYADALLLADDAEDRVAVNIGGIANLTVLERGANPNTVVAFDSGPGNMLIDAVVQMRTGGAQRYDANGALAAAGTIAEDALEAMLGDSYFSQQPPKSTGRERFGTQFLHAHAALLDNLSLEDACATLTALTARTLAAAIHEHAVLGARVIVSGGGAHNTTLMQQIARQLPRSTVQPSSAFGINVDAKEAIAFAVLGYETLRERPANVPRVTGARSNVVLGALVPHELVTLLSKVQSECQT